MMKRMKMVLALGVVMLLCVASACQRGKVEQSSGAMKVDDSTEIAGLQYVADAEGDAALYAVISFGDTLVVVCDPPGLFYDQPLAQPVTSEWIQSHYSHPQLRVGHDTVFWPHCEEEHDCSCGPQGFWVMGERDTLLFVENSVRAVHVDAEGDTFDYISYTSTGKWDYTSGIIADTLISFGGLHVGMKVKEVAAYVQLPKDLKVKKYNVVILVAPNVYGVPMLSRTADGNIRHNGIRTPFYHEYNCPHIEYGAVKLVFGSGKVQRIVTGWYDAYGCDILIGA